VRQRIDLGISDSEPEMAALVEDAVRVSEAAIVPREISNLVGAAVADLLINDTRQSPSNGSADNQLVADSDVIAPETFSSGESVRAPPASVDGLPKKLLILDVNGFLIDTCFKFDKSKEKLREPDGTVNNFLSEYACSFLASCSPSLSCILFASQEWW
jgi:hypothetical protein